MGTNYYHVDESDACQCCGRGVKRVHIGKSSGGWTFTFHGDDEGAEGIVSWEDWKTRLGSGGRIEDEYDSPVTLDDFAALVESKRGERYNHTLYCRIHHREHAERDCWLDPEGHAFSRGNFS